MPSRQVAWQSIVNVPLPTPATLCLPGLVLLVPASMRLPRAHCLIQLCLGVGHCATALHLQVLDKLLEQADSKQETFAKLAMANVHAYSAPYDRRKDGAVQRAEVHYSHALELYRRVLEKDEGAWGGGGKAGRAGQGRERPGKLSCCCPCPPPAPAPSSRR